jgi:hypothetical protein
MRLFESFSNSLDFIKYTIITVAPFVIIPKQDPLFQIFPAVVLI